MLGDLSDHTNQSTVFSVFGFSWGIGMVSNFACIDQGDLGSMSLQRTA